MAFDPDNPLSLAGAALVQIGSILVPIYDAAPSSAIAWAVWDPVQDEITVHFNDGDFATRPCSLAGWAAYRLSPSRGRYWNLVLK